jgi:hypothetical protein
LAATTQWKKIKMDTDLEVSDVIKFDTIDNEAATGRPQPYLPSASTGKSALDSTRKDQSNPKSTRSPRILKIATRFQISSTPRSTQSKSRPIVQAIKPQKFEVFPSSDSTNNKESHNKSATSLPSSSTGDYYRHKSLKDVDFNVRAPVTTITADVGFKNQSKHQALLASLRSQTILEMPVMRAFSLMKSKPKEKRDLSKLCAQSLYDMRISELKLVTQAESKEMGSTTEPCKKILAIENGSMKEDIKLLTNESIINKFSSQSMKDKTTKKLPVPSSGLVLNSPINTMIDSTSITNPFTFSPSAPRSRFLSSPSPTFLTL